MFMSEALTMQKSHKSFEGRHKKNEKQCKHTDFIYFFLLEEEK